jgi:hypothetical protein
MFVFLDVEMVITEKIPIALSARRIVLIAEMDILVINASQDYFCIKDLSVEILAN